MKKINFIFLMSLTLLCCTTNVADHSNNQPDIMPIEADEDGEYDVVVFDPQYQTFLQTVARPKNFYSLQYYRSRNIIYVTNWNSRVLNPVFDRNLYEVLIDYNQNIDYGLNLEYKLCNFFVFVEWKYHVDIDGRANRFL